MSISSNELKQYVPFLKKGLLGRHLSSPILYTENTFFFRLSGEGPHRFVLSLDDNEPRLYVAKDSIDCTSLDSKFLDQLKKELNNPYLVDVAQVGDDRVICFDFTIINSVFKEEGRRVYFEMIPHHANLIVTDLDNKILAAYRPGEMEDERPLLKGMIYQTPVKKGFLEAAVTFDEKNYLSNCLAEEASLGEKRKKDRFGFLLVSLKKKEKLLERKMAYIQADVKEAEKHVDDGRYGDAIFMSYGTILPKTSSFIYEGETILLDPSRSVSKNAELYYKRAKKSKETLSRGKLNLAKTKEEIDEVKIALAQIRAADENGLEALAKELGISTPTPASKKKTLEWHGLSHESLPSFVDFHGTKILFGKSAKQNDCLTFLFDTAKEHLWLHIIGNTGSHVMIKKEQPTPAEIEAAAEIALLNSNESEGEVMATKRENVRKGSVMGMTIVKEYKTLRISSISPEIRNLIASAQKVKF